MFLLSVVFFALFAWAYITTRIPNLTWLILACFFALMGRLDQDG